MSFFHKREGDPAPAARGKAIGKPSRRVTKDDISRPTLLPWGTSQSLPIMTSALRDNVRGHKRGKSEPFPPSQYSSRPANDAPHRNKVARIILSALPSSFSLSALSSLAHWASHPQSIKVMIPLDINKPLPVTPKLDQISLCNADVPLVKVTNASPISPNREFGEGGQLYRTIVCGSIGELIGVLHGEPVVFENMNVLEDEVARADYAAKLKDSVQVPEADLESMAPAIDDASLIRPMSACTLLEEACTTRDAPIRRNKQSQLTARSRLAPGDWDINRISMCLTEAGIEHRIEQIDETELDLLEADDSTLFDDSEMGETRPVPDGPVDVVLYVLRNDMDMVTDSLDVDERRFARGSTATVPSRPTRRHIRQRSMEEHFELEMKRKGTVFRDSFAYEDPLLFDGDFVDEPEGLVNVEAD
ncbi:hypothetical protein M408DRAFT_323974 [Serendipita vermifera MAFF 305830]|uniref:Uncharacterized protein n=1 Tax=Serendipita vermifera MAFF 305830 TaxID=933852 RepID=A0A0C3AC31_SERVB|nr:hypothetical protein M408DRAFT_323974 [Serendipita vermifera MAFF 305830]